MPHDTDPFTAAEVAYLGAQRLGRPATVDPGGAPRNSPVGCHRNAELGTSDIAGFALGASRKFANQRSNHHVAFVVDDVVSTDPWEVRGIEVHGVAEALDGEVPARRGRRRQLIGVHPRRVIRWHVDPAVASTTARAVGAHRARTAGLAGAPTDPAVA